MLPSISKDIHWNTCFQWYHLLYLCADCPVVGEYCFSHAGPAVWNSLYDDIIKLTTNTDRFNNLLKSHLFHLVLRHFVNTHGQSVSTLQNPICICIYLFVFELYRLE